MKKTELSVTVAKGARADYLAQNPKAAKLLKEVVKKIMHHASGYFEKAYEARDAVVDAMENARQAGEFLKEYIESLPGKKLTIDIWQQDRHLFRTHRM